MIPSRDDPAPYVEKRRVPIPERCGEPHPTLEWTWVDREQAEYVYCAETCWLPKGHDGAHRATKRAGGGDFPWGP